jgi:hypothetical protein
MFAYFSIQTNESVVPQLDFMRFDYRKIFSIADSGIIVCNEAEQPWLASFRIEALVFDERAKFHKGAILYHPLSKREKVSFSVKIY